MIFLLATLGIAASSPDGAVGRWRTETRNGIVVMRRCGASLCGRLDTSDILKAHPDTRDVNNREPALRTRRLTGLPMLGGFSFSDGAWTGGTIYNPDDGRTYQARLTAMDAGHLKVRGCVFVPLCKTQTWTRVR